MFLSIITALADECIGTRTRIQMTQMQAPSSTPDVYYIQATNTQTEIHTQILPRGWGLGSPGQCVIKLCLQPSLDISYQLRLGAHAPLSSSRNLGESEGSVSSPLGPNMTSSGQDTPTRMPSLSSLHGHLPTSNTDTYPTSYWALSLWTMGTLGAPPALEFWDSLTPC